MTDIWPFHTFKLEEPRMNSPGATGLLRRKGWQDRRSSQSFTQCLAGSQLIQPAARGPHAAQHKIANLLHTLWDFFVITCCTVCNVWPRDAKRPDAPLAPAGSPPTCSVLVSVSRRPQCGVGWCGAILSIIISCAFLYIGSSLINLAGFSGILFSNQLFFVSVWSLFWLEVGGCELILS